MTYQEAVQEYYGERLSKAWFAREALWAEKCGPVIVLEEDGLFASFIETDTEFHLLGLIAEGGQLTRKQAKALAEWMSYLRERLEQGKVVRTGLNTDSNPLMLRVLRGLPFNFEVGRAEHTEGGTWVGTRFWLDRGKIK
jgi:hypothetical protein